MFLVRLSPTSSTLSLSLAVIIIYHIAFDISIDKLNNIAFDILAILYIEFNRQMCYNKSIMEEMPNFSALPIRR